MKIKEFLSITKIFPTAMMLMVVLLAGCQKDEEQSMRPAVTSSDPANGATGIAVTSIISATFNTPMDAASITSSGFTLKNGSSLIPAVISYNGTTASLTPSHHLPPNTLCTATITAVKSAAGKTIASDFKWTFTTGAAVDQTFPVVVSANPIDGSTGIALNKVLSVTFNEPMSAATITTSSFRLSQGVTPIAGAVAYSGSTATFTPSAPLAAGTTYKGEITTGVKDMAGNALAADAVWTFTTTASASGLSAVDLGAAGNFVIVAKTAINNNPNSAITGDVALSPAATSYVTGFALTNATGYATSPQVTGKIYAADMASPTPVNLTASVENMITAYNDAAGRPSPDFLELGTGNVGGLTLSPGLYKWTSTVTMPTDLVISGSANDVWIFQISGDLTMSSGVNITLAGGAQAKNVFWQVAGAVTIGTTAHFEGVILSMTGITLQTGASINGRALAQTAVILDSNAVTAPQ
jgi:hypothetical protein